MKNVSFTERLVHAVGYEVFAVLLCAPLLSWIMASRWQRRARWR